MWAKIKNLFKKNKVIKTEIKNTKSQGSIYFDPLHDRLVIVTPITYGGLNAFCYVISDVEKHNCVLFDAPEFFEFTYIDEFS